MPKRLITILSAFLSVLMLAGCRSSKPDLEVMPHDDNTITITADKAGISGVGGAGITVADGQQLVIDSALSKPKSRVISTQNIKRTGRQVFRGTTCPAL
jgi:PBP1b-binding outer membrane lipoprotein LpoB